jgi:hypothetical protein
MQQRLLLSSPRLQTVRHHSMDIRPFHQYDGGAECGGGGGGTRHYSVDVRTGGSGGVGGPELTRRPQSLPDNFRTGTAISWYMIVKTKFLKYLKREFLSVSMQIRKIPLLCKVCCFFCILSLFQNWEQYKLNANPGDKGANAHIGQVCYFCTGFALGSRNFPISLCLWFW